MIARCPACAQLFPVLGNSLSPCPFCGAKLEITIERAHLESPADAAPAREPIAWEDGSSGGLFARFSKTVRAVLLAPHRFFRALDVDQLGGSISFAALVLVPPLLIHSASLYAVHHVDELRPFARVLGLAADGDAAMSGRKLVLIPIAATLFVTYLATFYQAASAIASRRRPPFHITVRGTCFGFAPMVLAVVPVVGLAVGFVWSLILHAIALRELHGLGRAQAAIVVVIPLVVIVLSFVYG